MESGLAGSGRQARCGQARTVIAGSTSWKRRRVPFTAKFLIGAAIGSGSTALAAERGGADFLLAINAGRLRSMGAPSIACMLPIFDAGPMTEQFAREELLTQCRIPVLLGVNVWGQTVDAAAVAESIAAAGFAGAVNFPSCMHYSRPMQQILSRAGRGIEREVELLSAVQERGLVSMFYCATRTQARLAADAGLDLVCLNLGWNVGGAVGHRQRSTLEEVATTAREIGRLIKRINPTTRFLLEGGPVATAEDLARIVSLAPIDGYVGGSTIERMPLEVSVADQIDRFRWASRPGRALDRESNRLISWSRQFGFAGRSKHQLVFLRRLRALADSANPVLVVAERGSELRPVLRALCGDRGQGPGPATMEIDVSAEDYPARARALLFGQRDGAAKRRPALADSTVEQLIIVAPERLPVATQRRLARALREGVFRAAGSRRNLSLEPRVILVAELSADETTLETALLSIGMDPQLAELLAGWTLRVPPLREHVEDLIAIIEARSESVLGRRVDRSGFSSEALRRLQAYRWPGNEAELMALLGSLAGKAPGTPVQPSDLDFPSTDERIEEPEGRGEKDRIVDALWRHGFNRTRTAEALGISRKTLYNKIQKFGLAG